MITNKKLHKSWHRHFNVKTADISTSKQIKLRLWILLILELLPINRLVD